MYALEIQHIISLKSAPSILDPQAEVLAKRPPDEVNTELRNNMLSPVQINNFTGILTNIVPVKLMTKNCSIKSSWLERILNIQRDA